MMAFLSFLERSPCARHDADCGPYLISVSAALLDKNSILPMYQLQFGEDERLAWVTQLADDGPDCEPDSVRPSAPEYPVLLPLFTVTWLWKKFSAPCGFREMVLE